jgi:hypothetical protein
VLFSLKQYKITITFYQPPTNMDATPLSEEERRMASILFKMMGPGMHDNCDIGLNAAYAAVWAKMKNGSQ